MNAQCNCTSLSGRKLILPQLAPPTFNISVSSYRRILSMFGQNILTKDAVLSAGDYDQKICIEEIKYCKYTKW